MSPGSDTRLTQIVVYNRTTCGDRLSNFTISVIDSAGETVWSQDYTQPTSDGEAIVFDTGTIYGEYVKIQKNDSNYLHLAEVKVFDFSTFNAVSRVDPTVDFNWGDQASPAPGIEGTNWVATWQGTVTADYSEDYTFYATADDGVRLWVNGQLLCDGWQDQSSTTYSGTIHLEAGQSYSILMEYYQAGGGASAKLEWSSASQAREVIPASNLSCASVLGQESVAPDNSVPGDQSATVNQPVVFSADNGNAITVSGTDSATSSSASSLVFSSSFENPVLNWGDVSGGGNGGGNQGGWNLVTWDGANDESAICANSSAYGNPDAPDGAQVLCLQGTATAWQDVTFTEAGKYTLSFLAAYTSNTQGGGWGAGVNPFAVQIDGVTVGTFTPGSSDHFDAFQTDSFTLSAGVHRVTFVGLTNDGSDRVSFVDNVAITKVADVLQVNLAVDSGTLTLAHSDGLAFLSGDGVNESTMSFLGSADDINAALDGLEYMPATADYVGSANLQITTSNLASALVGGPKITTDTIAINQSLPSDFSGLFAAYYGNADFAGTPVYRVDPTVNFDWSNGESPAPGTPASGWSARWQGEIQTQDGGEYQFRVTGDGNAALYVDGQLVYGPSSAADTGPIELDAGQSYSFRLDYQPGSQAGAVKVEWLAPGQSDWQVVPSGQLSCADLLQAQNSAPVNSVPGDTQNGVLNTPLVFSADQGNGISVSDPGVSYGQPLQVTLVADYGTISLGGTSGLNFSAGDGTDDASMTFTGSADDINAALQGLKFMPSNEFLGTAQLTITTNDQAPIFANGGPQSTTSTIDINVPAPANYQGLLAIYQNMDGTGSPVVRIDQNVDFEWGNQSSPAPGIEGSNWTVTWQGTLTPDASGDYTFYASGNGGAQLWIDGNLVCGDPANQGSAEFSNAETIHLDAGQSYALRMVYLQTGGDETAKLEWSSGSTDRQVISASDLSCADVVHENAAPVNNLPGDQALEINTSLIFSSAHGNAITVGDPDVDPSTSSAPVGNGDFESPVLDPEAYVWGDSYGGWNFQTMNYADGSYNDSGIVSNNNSSWFANYSPAPSGQQVAFIESQGTMWQDVNFAEGGNYTLSLQAAYSNWYWGASPTNPILVQVDGQNVGVIYPNSTDYKTYMTDSFAVTAGTHRISFTGLCPVGDDTISFIDNVSIDKTSSFVQVTLAADHGTLSLAETNGLIFSDGTGQGDCSMTMTGTVTNINAALDGLQLTPDANFLGDCHLTVTTDDLALAVTGGPKTTTTSVAVNVAMPTEYTGLLATYYDSTDLSGPGVQRIDPTVDFGMGNWGSEVSPAPSIPGTNWSACWQGKIQATVTGTYTFYVTGDDGVKLWVNDAYVDGWKYQSATTYTLTTDLVAGQWYTIRMEYFQGGGNEVAKLEWSAVDGQGTVIQPQEVVPASQLSCENSAPVNSVPDQQSTDENTPLYFSAANGNAIQVSDLDTIDGTLQVTLSVDHGTLTLAGTNGLTFSDGGNGTGFMTISGARSDINAALDGLCYTPAISQSGGYISAATLTISTNDMATAMTGGAKTTVSTVSVAITAPWQYNGVLGTYYSNADFTGTSYQRIDSAINFDWGNAGSPIEGIDGTTWSARWVGTITPDASGTYTFYTTADDGVRLWVNGELLIDHLDNTGTDSYSATIDLVAGQSYSFRMDYRQVSGAANAKLEWSVAGQPRQVIAGDDLQTADQTPLNVVPGEQLGIGTQPIVFSENLGNAIGVVEAHYDGQPLTVTLTATHGSLALGSEDGLTVTRSDDSSTITLIGSLDDINAALDGLTFARQDGYAGEGSIQITSTNPWPSSGPRSSTSTIQIGAVQASNPGLVATYYSDTWLGTAVTTQVDSAVNLDGNGGSPAAGVAASNWSACWDGLIQIPQTGTYTFYTSTDAGCRLWVNNQLLIDNWGSQTAATNSATIDLAGGQQYSIRMEYQHFGGADSAKLEWSGPNQPRAAVSAGVLSHQDQSPLYYLPAAQTTNENTPLVFSTAKQNAISIGDVDAQSGLLQVTLVASNGSVTLGDAGGLNSLVYGPDNASVTFSGNLTQINAALQGLTFTPASNQSGGASLRITTVDLGTGKTADSSLPITIVAVNQPPTIQLPASPTLYDYQTLSFSGQNTIVIGDPDIDPQAAAVTVTNGDFESTNIGVGYYSDQYHGATPGWTLVPMYWTNGNTVPNSSGLAGNGAGIGNPNSTDGTQVAYIQGGATLSQNVTFAEAGTYTISFQAAYRQYGGQHAFSVLVNGLCIATINPSSLDFRGYSAAFTVTAGTHRITFCGATETSDKTAFIDHVSIAKTSSLVQVSLSMDHGTLNMGEKNGLVFAYGDGVDDTSMTFTGSLADVNAALSSLQFTPYAGYRGAANLRITTNDLGNVGLGGPKSVTRTLVINVHAMNDAPWNSVPLTTQGTYGNQPLVFSTAGSNGITVGDPDAGNFPIQVTLTVSHGTLTLNGTDGLTITAGADGSNTVTVQGTIASINATLNGLSYTADSGYIGNDEKLLIHTDDLGHCGDGGALTADSTVNINVLGGPVVNTTIDGVQQTSWQSPQAVASDANGDYVVVWTSQTADGWDVYARRFNANGNAQGDEFLVNSADANGDHAAGDQMYAAVAMNADGSFVVTWTDLNGANGTADICAKCTTPTAPPAATNSW